MLEKLKSECNITLTENGACTYLSSGSACLDLFATAGALRNQSSAEIEKRFMQAYAEDNNLAMKLLFYARDIRGGLGERQLFRIISKWLAYYAPESLVKNLKYIAEFGRYDDIVMLLGTSCETAAVKVIKNQLDKDRIALQSGKPVSLLAKWLPSVNASKRETVIAGKRLSKLLGMSEAAYRKLLSQLRRQIRIIENNLRTRDYTFDYSKQPSKAMFKYRKAFIRNDKERYNDFMVKVARGEKTIHTGTLTPYDIIQSLFQKMGYWDLSIAKLSASERQAIDATWKAQEDFTCAENALVVVDGSGSMYSGDKVMPISIAVSLGIYFAERNMGA